MKKNYLDLIATVADYFCAIAFYLLLTGVFALLAINEYDAIQRGINVEINTQNFYFNTFVFVLFILLGVFLFFFVVLDEMKDDFKELKK